MKQYMKKIIIYLMTVVYIFISCSFYVNASEHGGGGGSDHNPYFITDAGTINVEDDGVVMYYIEYILANIGAIFVDHDITKAMANDQTMKGYISKGKYDANQKTVTFPKETVIYVKQCLDTYLKTEQTKEDNGGFYLLPTTKYIDVPANSFSNSFQYQTFRNIVLEKGLLSVTIRGMYFTDPFSDPDHPIYLVADAMSLSNFEKNPDLRLSFNFFCAYDWVYEKKKVMEFTEDNKVYTSCSEAVHVDRGTYSNVSGGGVNGKDDISVINYSLYSSTGETVRVFVSQNAAKNYSVGKRKVYITNNYYDYEPEDLTVSIDDLQKSVSDLQKIIDELLKRVTDKTSEKEIMELLRLILEELRNQQGTGGGGGASSGDVTVNVDLNTTNNWLSKIYDKVSQIFDKISSSAGQSMSEVVESIENLQKMLKKYLSEITGDLDDIKGQLEEMTEQEFSDKTDSFLEETTDSFSEIGEIAKTKFPLSIPYDLQNLFAVISPKPPEASESVIYSAEQSVYSGNTLPVYESNGKMLTVREGGGGGSLGMSATGAPVFNLPIVINSVGWDYTITVDMSQFQSVADLSRTLFTLIFIWGLIKLSIPVIGLWGDLID